MKKLLIGAVALLAASASLAQVPPPAGVSQGTTPVTAPQAAPRTQQIRIYMSDDKVMTRDQVAEHVRQMFQFLDANRDGFITRDELASMHERMMGMHENMAKQMAGHGMQGHDRAAAFDRLDTNHDGMISRQEFMAAKPRVEERRMMVMRDGSMSGGHGMNGMHMHGAGFTGHIFEVADANHDGRVSLQEAVNAALQRFDRADLNHDGKLTPEERQQAHRLMRGSRRPS